MKRLALALLALLLPAFASAQVYNKFGPATGVLKGSTSTYQTTAAASSDVLSLWSGTCNSSTFLRGDGACAAASISTPVSATNGGTGEAGTITGIPKANSTSAFTAAASADVYSLWSGTCNSTTFLRGDGACAAAGGGSAAGSDTQVQYNASAAFAAQSNFAWDYTNKNLILSTTSGQATPILTLKSAAGFAGVTQMFDDSFASSTYFGAAFVSNLFTLGAVDNTGALQGHGLDIIAVGNNVSSSTLKAQSSHSLGITSNGTVMVNGSGGTAGLFLMSNGGSSPATWSQVYYSGQVSSFGASALTAGTCNSNTVSIGSASAGMGVVATPNTYPGDGFYWYGYVSSFGTVTVKVCAVVSGTPTASTYEVRVLP